MKKFVKLSLAAAVATAGLTSANAGSLEEMIKGVDAFGYANLRYNSYEADQGANTQTTYHKIVLGVTSKITDDISYTYAGAVTSSEETTTEGVGYTGGNFYTVYSNFTYTGIDGVTAILGQQAVGTPFTKAYDTYGGTQEGTGIALVTSLGGVNITAASLVNTNVGTGDKFAAVIDAAGNANKKVDVGEIAVQDAANSANLNAITASTKIGNVSVNGTFLDIEDIANGYTIGAKTSVKNGDATFEPYARYTSLDIDTAAATAMGASEDNALWYVGTTFKIGNIGGKLAYGETDKNGGLVAVDNDAEAAFLGWNLCMNGIADAEMLQAQINMNVLSNVNVALQHNTLDDATTSDDDETFVTVTYKPSKNFTAYIRGGVDEIDGVENNRGRIQLTYTF